MITSRQNSLVKRIRHAMREHAAEIVLEGPKQVEDALAAGLKPVAVLRRGVDVSNAVFDSVADTRSPQDVIALFERPANDAQRILSRRDSIVVALDGVQDPGNVGSIVRLAAAFDAAGVILLPGCADPFAPKAIRASAGAALSVPLAQISVDELIECGLPLIAASLDGDQRDPPAREAVLVLGSEGSGVSEPIAARAQRIFIPMSHRVESLNVGAAAAILLSLSFRLRG
jgi:TrmH family RNA methyltransferase